MIIKIILTILMLGCILVGTSIWYTAIQPEVYTNLALEQFKNPNIQTDTSLRGLSGSDAILAIPFICWVLVTLFMFKKEIVKLWEKV